MQVGEVGELSEIFQWKGEVPKGLPDWFSDICGVDLGKAALRKVELNAIKYPVKVLKEEVSSKQEQNSTTTNNNGIGSEGD
ncbi:hypothetical protein RIF29_15725 [Crotalaria pallida]|uniref:Uncharacterized protein n=1 Tax=Crotalaria pallida TaxID=3830 RepID=A0AAN9IDU0_CROPI